MQLYRPAKRNQSGFSVIEVLLVVLVVAALAATGFVVYQHQKNSNKRAAATNSYQTSSTTQPAQTATQYLTTKEWRVRLTLDSTTASLYYHIKPNLPNVAYFSLK